MIRDIVDGEDGVDDDPRLILFVSLLHNIVLKSIDGDDEVVRKLGYEVMLNGLHKIVATS